MNLSYGVEYNLKLLNKNMFTVNEVQKHASVHISGNANKSYFYKTRQYNIQIYDKNIFFSYRTRQLNYRNK